DFNNNGSLNYENYGLSQNGLTTARQVPVHSVLMVCIGATIGKCGFSERAIATNQQVNALTPTNNFSYRYIYYQMLSDSFQRLVINNSGQATLPIINKTKWSKLSLSFPPTIKEQIRIENLLDSLSVETQRLESVYRRKLELLADLKQSLLHKAFTGELTADQLYETPESEDLLKVAES
ncbi:MAG: restriction endonuclease subunit S, partial [Opitutales bacterium]